LKTCLEARHLKLLKLPPNFDALSWPRLLLNPGKDSARCLFTRAGLTTALLKQPLTPPLWRGPGLSAAELSRLRADWQPLPARLTEPGSKTTVREYQPGEARDFARDFSFCEGRKFALIRVEDPYALATPDAVTNLKRFLESLRSHCGHWPDELKIQARESPEFGGQAAARAALERQMQTADVPKFAVTLIPRFGSRRRDFHDRRIVFVPDARKPQKRVTVLLTGGVDRYLEPRFECGIVVHQT
jgi:hypothetical protein